MAGFERYTDADLSLLTKLYSFGHISLRAAMGLWDSHCNQYGETEVRELFTLLISIEERI